MSLDRISDVEIDLSEPPVGVAGLDLALAAVILTSPQDTVWDAEYGASTDVIEISRDDYLDTLELLGVTSSEDFYRGLVDHFSQELEPDRVLVGRRATAVAQVVSIDIIGTSDGAYTITINGNDYSFNASTSTATQIETGLINAVNGGTDPVTATAGTGDQVVLTADVAGVPFTVSVESPSADLDEPSVDTASVGHPEDIQAFRAERDDWYLYLETSRNVGNIQAAGEAIEALPVDKIFGFQTNDANAQNNGSSADIGSVLGPTGLNLHRTFGFWHDNNDDFVDFAIAGRMLPTPAGEAIPWANKGLSSVVGIVPTSESTLVAKNYSWLEAFDALNRTATQGGTMVDGQWIDLVRGRDYLKRLIQTRCAEALLNNDVVPYSDEGAAIIAAAIRGALNDCPMVVKDTIVITMPRASAQSDANRALRHFPDIRFRATLRGAIHTLQIRGHLAP